MINIKMTYHKIFYYCLNDVLTHFKYLKSNFKKIFFKYYWYYLIYYYKLILIFYQVFDIKLQ